MDLYFVWIWIGLIILTAIIEAATDDLISIWFCASSLIALILAACRVPWPIQIAVFVIISLILLLVTRPLAKKYMRRNEIKTNIDGIIGKIGICTEDIKELGRGQVKIEGSFWSAISSEELISKDDHVEVLAVEGVKLIVKKVEE